MSEEQRTSVEARTSRLRQRRRRQARAVAFSAPFSDVGWSL
ncbi:MAG: hypothetical protein ACR2GR_10790 [Rhodothermales bacterium]